MTAVDDDIAFRAVRDLVDRGEYRDELPTTKDPNVDPRLADALGGASDRLREMLGMDPISTPRRLRVMVERNSAEHRAAREAGEMEALPNLHPAPPGAIDEAEAAFGHSIPPLLRRLYVEVGNGGFGPGYGLLPVGQAHPDPLHRPNHLKDGLWPVCDWGCAIVSLIDCRTGDWRMWGFDPNPVPVGEALFEDEFTFAQWIHRWATDRLFQPSLIEDAESGQWRGATQAEMSEWF